MAIITRDAKGAPLSHAEMDGNLLELEGHTSGLKLPDTAGAGMKLGDGETYGWHDLRGSLERDDVMPAVQAVFIGGLKAFQFTAEGTQSLYTAVHIPHDYVPGTDLFIHVHWAHNSATVTGGSVTWGFEASYAKGHQQAAFSAPVTVSVAQSADLARYQHMVAEGALSVSGGSGTQLDTDLIEVDGMILIRLFLDSNDITDSVTQPDPFAFFVDVHYQSTGMPTLNKSPAFYGA